MGVFLLQFRWKKKKINKFWDSCRKCWSLLICSAVFDSKTSLYFLRSNSGGHSPLFGIFSEMPWQLQRQPYDNIFPLLFGRLGQRCHQRGSPFSWEKELLLSPISDVCKICFNFHWIKRWGQGMWWSSILWANTPLCILYRWPSSIFLSSQLFQYPNSTGLWGSEDRCRITTLKWDLENPQYLEWASKAKAYQTWWTFWITTSHLIIRNAGSVGKELDDGWTSLYSYAHCD